MTVSKVSKVEVSIHHPLQAEDGIRIDEGQYDQLGLLGQKDVLGLRGRVQNNSL